MVAGKVAVLSGTGLEIVTEDTKSPLDSEIIAEVVVAGICGSDVHRLAGDIVPSAIPICFGHEAVGMILELGKNIHHDRLGNEIFIGDMIYWCPSTPCGTCRACVSSNALLCKDLNWPPPAGTPNAAGFREYATLNHRCAFVLVPPNVDPLAIIALGCAMPTAIRGFTKLHPVGPQTQVVIQGSGPVGLACTILAKLAGARFIAVIGDPDSRLQAAASLGATHVMSLSSTTKERRSAIIKQATDGQGASLVIEAAGATSAFPEGLDFLGMNGQYLILGLYSGKAVCAIDPVRINNLNLEIIGSLGVDPAHYWETVRIASVHGERLGLANLVTHKFPLEQLEEAIDTVRRGDSIKAVIALK